MIWGSKKIRKILNAEDTEFRRRKEQEGGLKAAATKIRTPRLR
jgi:hypothetical protein